MTISEDWLMNLSIIEASRILLFQMPLKSSYLQNKIWQNNTHFKYLQKTGNGIGNLEVYFPINVVSPAVSVLIMLLFP